MRKTTFCRYLFLATCLVTSLTSITQALDTKTLTVVVNGITHKTGDICLRIYADPQGFPLDSNGGIESKCTKIAGSSQTTVFSDLKPGNYAVVVLDDQTGDRQLHQDFLGIPQDGFGLSRNPKVSMVTGIPKFSDASFPLMNNKTIKIAMKYSLDR
jgi:uncharacterized protein (DUF2141 family)